jgi:hypothetical protein
MRALGQAFRLAAKKKLIDRIPYIPKFRENNACQGFFEKEEFERVMSVLPHDLRDFTRFASGRMRESGHVHLRSPHPEHFRPLQYRQ